MSIKALKSKKGLIKGVSTIDEPPHSVLICSYLSLSNPCSYNHMPHGVFIVLMVMCQSSCLSSSRSWKSLRRRTKLLLRYFSRTILFSASCSGVPWNRIFPSNSR